MILDLVPAQQHVVCFVVQGCDLIPSIGLESRVGFLSILSLSDQCNSQKLGLGFAPVGCHQVFLGLWLLWLGDLAHDVE